MIWMDSQHSVLSANDRHRTGSPVPLALVFRTAMAFEKGPA
jgi:hypothetical protein